MDACLLKNIGYLYDSIGYFNSIFLVFFFELKVYVCVTGLDIILRFEKCSLNVHNRLRFSIKK